MSKKTRILLGSLLVLLLVGAAVLIVVMSQTDYAVLFTGLNETDMSSVVSYLEENGVTDYRIQNNDTILVPADQEPQLKAQLIMADLPGSGFAYSTYLDNVGSLSTESDRQTAFLFELQDRLSAVIRCLDGVKDAHVTIAQGEDRRYVLDQRQYGQRLGGHHGHHARRQDADRPAGHCHTESGLPLGPGAGDRQH